MGFSLIASLPVSSGEGNEPNELFFLSFFYPMMLADRSAIWYGL